MTRNGGSRTCMSHMVEIKGGSWGWRWEFIGFPVDEGQFYRVQSRAEDGWRTVGGNSQRGLILQGRYLIHGTICSVIRCSVMDFLGLCPLSARASFYRGETSQFHFFTRPAKLSIL